MCSVQIPGNYFSHTREFLAKVVLNWFQLSESDRIESFKINQYWPCLQIKSLLQWICYTSKYLIAEQK